MNDPLEAVLERHDQDHLRFRGAVVTSAAVHTLVALTLLLAPLLLPRQSLLPDVVPVRLVELGPPPSPQPQPAVAEETEAVEEAAPEESLPEPEPEPAVQAVEEPPQRQPEPEERKPEPEPQPQRAARTPQPETQSARRSSSPEPAQPQSARRSLEFSDTAGRQGGTVEDFPFRYYLDQVRQAIAARWDPPPRPPHSAARSAVVYFRIGRQGQLVLARLERGAGDEVYDLAARRAVQSARFPPLPRTYQGDSVGIYLVFTQE